MALLPMFPLGSVLFPGMPLGLRVFEPRYLIMLDRMLRSGSTEFGVVLIERGQEVGGGEQRFAYGTVAEIRTLGAEEGHVGLVAFGGRRFHVEAWREDEPYAQAEVADLADLVWHEDDRAALEETEAVVRRTLALASEFTGLVWPATTELSDDPLTACWQLAGIAPLGPLDQLRLLRAEMASDLLAGVRAGCEDAAAGFSAGWSEEG